MTLQSLHDRDALAAFLGRDRARHLYALGDLDDFFWPRTVWYGLGDPLEAVLLLYLAPQVPCLLAFGDDPVALEALVEAAAPLLPGRFYAHVEHGLEARFEARGWRVSPHGLHRRMALEGPPQTDDLDLEPVRWMTPGDLDALLALYARSYPGNWFDARMLETGRYVAALDDQRLGAVAGVHTWSPTWGVAALGNITTDPDLRRRGLGLRATAALCQRLSTEVALTGLNVLDTNAGAIALYERLGFQTRCAFMECMVEAR